MLNKSLSLLCHRFCSFYISYLPGMILSDLYPNRDQKSDHVSNSVFKTHRMHLKHVRHARIADSMERCWHLWRSSRSELPLTCNSAHIRSCCLSRRQDTTNQLLNSSSCISQLLLSSLALIFDSKSAFCSLLSVVFAASSCHTNSAAMHARLYWSINNLQFLKQHYILWMKYNSLWNFMYICPYLFACEVWSSKAID